MRFMGWVGGGGLVHGVLFMVNFVELGLRVRLARC